ncbi:acylphosphatase [Oerskovia turbata]
MGSSGDETRGDAAGDRSRNRSGREAQAALRATVHGRVQGVGFRYATTRRAAALGLACDALNLPDGTVLVTAHGHETAVAALLDWLRGGTTPGQVTRVDVDEV